MTTVLVDYDSGNLHSAQKAFERMAVEGNAGAVIVTSDPDVVAKADRIVLPGDGAFPHCKNELFSRTALAEAIIDSVTKRAVPFMGICVGMQMLATTAMRPELAAWVLLVQGAHAKRGGDLAAARAAWQSVVERHASTRDERGLRHAHAARNELLAIDGEHLGELVALHDELLRDRSSLEDTAGAAMAESLLRRIEARDPAAAEAARLRLLAAARPLRLDRKSVV